MSSSQTVGVPTNPTNSPREPPLQPRRASVQSDADQSLREGLSGVSNEFMAPLQRESTQTMGNIAPQLGNVPPTQTYADLSVPGSMAMSMTESFFEAPVRQTREFADPVGDSTYVAVAGPTQGNKMHDPTPSQRHSRYPRTIEGTDEFYKTIREGLAVVYYFAEWCPPCRLMDPKFNSFADLFPTAQFVRVDTDDFVEIANEFKVDYMPTVQIFKNGEKLDEFVGSDAEQLRQIISLHVTKTS